MNKGKVTVIIPFVNEHRLLSEAVESVTGQTYTNIEILLVNNNAKKDVLEEAHEWEKKDSRIRVVLEEKQGIPSARNRGILESTGEFLTFLDADDAFVPTKIEKQVNVLIRNPEAPLVYSYFDEVSPDDIHKIVKPDQGADSPRWLSYIIGHKTTYRENPFVDPKPSTSMVPKKLAIDVGMFNEEFNPFWIEDTLFNLNLYEKGKFLFIPESLTKKRLGSPQRRKDTLLELRSRWIALKNQDLLFNILVDRYRDPSDSQSVKGFKKLRSQWMREFASLFLRYRSGTDLGRKILAEAIREEPFNYKNWKEWIKALLPRSTHPMIFGFDALVDQDIDRDSLIDPERIFRPKFF